MEHIPLNRKREIIIADFLEVTLLPFGSVHECNVALVERHERIGLREIRCDGVRTDAWVAHQLEVSVRDIEQFKRQNELVSDEDLSSANGLVQMTSFGAIQGTLIARLGLPSFIVTLAGFLGLQGVMLELAQIDKTALGRSPCARFVR